MNIIDIVIAKNKSFTNETASLVQQAQTAMADANNIVDRLEAIEQQATNASEVAVSAAASATEAAQNFDDMKADLIAAAQELLGDAVDNLVDTKLGNTLTDVTTLKDNVNDLTYSVDALNNSTIPALQDQVVAASQSGGDTVTITNNNTSAAKIKTINITHNNTTTPYNIEKNYTVAGQNEDGSMTQKAITNYVQNEIQTAINNLDLGDITNYNNTKIIKIKYLLVYRMQYLKQMDKILIHIKCMAAVCVVMCLTMELLLHFMEILIIQKMVQMVR